jgi:cystathionine beta-lyase/cystathionine gamma-synthase
MSDPRRPHDILGPSAPLVPPLYQASVYTLPDLDALDRVTDGREPGFFYARDSHPNAHHLGAQLAALEGAEWGQVCASGMGAIVAMVLSLLRQGDRIVASNRLYGRTMQLFTQELPRFGIQTTLIDTSDWDAVCKALETPTCILYAETISNPLLRVPDLGRLADLAHEHNCQFLVDNTFATPILCRPLELGADLVMESLTKMIGGHSDLTLGFVGGKGDLLPRLSQTASIWGVPAGPFDCWLATRGLVTLPLRMKAACANAAALATWLQAQPQVARVLYPGLQSHVDHEVAQRILPLGCGNMLCFELRGGREAVNRFMHKAQGIPFSPSLGHVTTTCSHPGTTSHRYVSAEEKQRQGITDGLIRLSVGIEELAGIQSEVMKGLQ